MLDVVYSERWPAPNTQGTFRLVVALLYQFFVVYVCNIPHCAQNVNRFHGESRDSISFFHPGGGSAPGFPPGRAQSAMGFHHCEGNTLRFCRSCLPVSQGHSSSASLRWAPSPGEGKALLGQGWVSHWAENVRRCLKIRFETPPRRFHYVSNTRSSCRRKWRTAS